MFTNFMVHQINAEIEEVAVSTANYIFSDYLLLWRFYGHKKSAIPKKSGKAQNHFGRDLKLFGICLRGTAQHVNIRSI